MRTTKQLLQIMHDNFDENFLITLNTLPDIMMLRGLFTIQEGNLMYRYIKGNEEAQSIKPDSILDSKEWIENQIKQC